MLCPECAKRQECRQMCAALSEELSRLEGYQRERVMDPEFLSRLSEQSGLTWAELLPDHPWPWGELLAGLRVLSPELLRPFLLHYYEGRGVVEVARELRLHRTTVNRRLRRAVRLVKAELERQRRWREEEEMTDKMPRYASRPGEDESHARPTGDWLGRQEWPPT